MFSSSILNNYCLFYFIDFIYLRMKVFKARTDLRQQNKGINTMLSTIISHMNVYGTDRFGRTLHQLH